MFLSKLGGGRPITLRLGLVCFRHLAAVAKVEEMIAMASQY